MVRRLEQFGYKNIFVDFHESKGFLGGSNFTQVMFDRMTQADIFMPLLSPGWLDSKWVFAELYLARYLKKQLLPVVIEPLDMRPMPPGLTEFIAIDFHTSEEDGARRLDLALRSLGADPRVGFRFKGFMSYSRVDTPQAEALHAALGGFNYPKSLQQKRTPLGAVPERLGTFFRDTVHLGAEQSLPKALERTLRDSEYLIVLCSPNAAASKWVNAEITQFLQFRDPRNVLAVLVDGARDSLEKSFPLAFQGEPLAPDLAYHGLEGVVERLAASMAGLEFDELSSRIGEEKATHAARPSEPRTTWWPFLRRGPASGPQ